MSIEQTILCYRCKNPIENEYAINFTDHTGTTTKKWVFCSRKCFLIMQTYVRSVQEQQNDKDRANALLKRNISPAPADQPNSGSLAKGKK